MASYRDLEVYQTGYRLALEIHQLTMTFPETERLGLVDQMRRACRSIPANLAEGLGHRFRAQLCPLRWASVGQCQ